MDVKAPVLRAPLAPDEPGSEETLQLVAFVEFHLMIVFPLYAIFGLSAVIVQVGAGAGQLNDEKGHLAPE